MSRIPHAPVPAPPGSTGDLVRLIEMEQALATRLEATTRECTGIVAAAREEATAAERELEARVAREVHAAADRIAAETAARIAAMETAARARAERYTAVPEATVATLADGLLRWLTAAPGSAS